MMFGTREYFDYFQCSSCGCLQILRVPSDLQRFYPPTYYSFNQPTPESSASSLRRAMQKQRVKAALFGKGIRVSRFLAPFVRFPSSLRTYGATIKKVSLTSFADPVLDVGCGSHSWWLNALRRLGFDNLLGADPYIEKDTCVGGIPVVKRAISELSGQYRLITFHHSLEHIPEQLETMRHARRLLAPSGVCLVRIPTVSSSVWERYGTNWVELDAPRHLYLHSRRSIELLGNRAGFELFDVVDDATEFEFAGSEQYMRDIPLFAEHSYLVNSAADTFSADQMAQFRNEAARVNAEHRAGRAGFFFRASA